MPAKAVSRLIRPGTDLDSRVRGNDESGERACGQNSLFFIFCRLRKLMNRFVVQLAFISWLRSCRAGLAAVNS